LIMSASFKTHVVVTSISGPNPILREIATGCQAEEWGFVVAGDRRSPADFEIEGCRYLDIEAQRSESPRYGALCPENSYVRKNIAYLSAVARGADTIVETDDDNLPLTDFWRRRELSLDGRIASALGWLNVYRFFCDGFIYPRGFPLDAVRASQADGAREVKHGTVLCPIQQGLVDEQPDVDAVFRLLSGEAPPFRHGAPVILDEFTWCPFNSQNTMFSESVFPLLYLPASCTFRATDIWRGFVAQRLLWTCGWRLAFTQADVRQIRNPHNLLSDLELEVPVYLLSRKIAETLDALSLPGGSQNLTTNLLTCYEALARIGAVESSELNLLSAWLQDLSDLGWTSTGV